MSEWTSRSETGPSLPQDFGGDSDHGADKLAKLVKDHSPTSTHGLFLADSDYKVDRKNVNDVSTKVPEHDAGTYAKDSD